LIISEIDLRISIKIIRTPSWKWKKFFLS